MSPNQIDEPLWKTLDRRVVHSGRVVIAEHTVELPNAERSTFEVDHSIPFAVAVFLVDVDLVVHLTRQYRYPINRWIYDLPGGAGHQGETPEAAARRECEEETGHIPGTLRRLHTFYPNPGRSDWPVHLFLASDSARGIRDRSDPFEQVTAAPLPLNELDSLIRSGSIVDPSLLLARMYAALGGWLPPIS